VPNLRRTDQLVLWILASDRGRLQDIARLQPPSAQRVEVAKAVELESAHARILATWPRVRQYDWLCEARRRHTSVSCPP